MTASTDEPHGIFISYRRQDTEGFAIILYDHLSKRFGSTQVFKDFDSIQPGDDFRGAILSSIRSSHTMLVVIGPSWLSAVDDQSQRRLGAPNDLVRFEIENALRHGLAVIPILVPTVSMPPASDLPPSIVKLASKQSLELTRKHTQQDLQRLDEALIRIIEVRRRRGIPADSGTRSTMGEPAVSKPTARAVRAEQRPRQPSTLPSGRPSSSAASTRVLRRSGRRRTIEVLAAAAALYVGIFTVAAGVEHKGYLWFALTLAAALLTAPACRPFLQSHFVTSVQTVLLDGAPLIVMLDSGGTVRTVTPQGHQVGRTIREARTRRADASRPTRIESIVAADLDGTAVLVTGSSDGTVRIWDVATGGQIDGPIRGGSRQPITALVVATMNDEPLLVAGRDDGSIWLWSLTTRRLLSNFDSFPGTAVVALAHTVVDREHFVAIGLTNGVVYSWHITATNTTNLSGIITPGQSGSRPRALTCVIDRACRGLIVVAAKQSPGERNTQGAKDASIYDVVTRQAVGSLVVNHADMTDYSASPTALAAAHRYGRPTIVSGSYGGHVFVWDATSMTLAAAPLTGHRAPISAVSVYDDLVIAAGDDGTVRAWTLQ